MVVNPIDNINSTSVHFYILPANISKNTLTTFFKNGQIYTVYCSYEPKYCIEMGHVIYGARGHVDAHNNTTQNTILKTLIIFCYYRPGHAVSPFVGID